MSSLLRILTQFSIKIRVPRPRDLANRVHGTCEIQKNGFIAQNKPLKVVKWPSLWFFIFSSICLTCVLYVFRSFYAAPGRETYLIVSVVVCRFGWRDSQLKRTHLRPFRVQIDDPSARPQSILPRKHPGGSQKAPTGIQSTKEAPAGLGLKKWCTSQLKV